MSPDEALARSKAAASGLLYADLARMEIATDVLRIIPKSAAAAHGIIAYELRGATAGIAALDPRDSQALEAVNFLMAERGLEAALAVASAAGLRAALKRYDAEPEPRLEEAPEHPSADLAGTLSAASIASSLLRDAVRLRASEAHLEPGARETRVRIRTGGALRTLKSFPGYLHPAVVMRLKYLAGLDVGETRRPQEGRILQRIGGGTVEFDVLALPVAEGEKIALRVRERNAGFDELERLGFRSSQLAPIQEALRLPGGLVLVAGPDRVGTSETLSAMLHVLRDEGAETASLEEPVETRQPGIRQIEVRPEAGLTFAAGLRALIRQDPRAILVDGMTDRETACLAAEAALTGQLILGRVQARRADRVVPDLLELGLEPSLLASSVSLIVFQRLVPGVCGKCRTPSKISPAAEKKLRSMLGRISSGGDLVAYDAAGCGACNDTGRDGFVTIAECMDARGRRHDGLTLSADAALKASEGLIAVDDALRLAGE